MKHVCSFVAAAAMLNVSFIPAFIPAPFGLKMLLVGSGLLGLLAFGVHLLLQSREDKKREAKQEEKTFTLIKAVAAEFESKLALSKTATTQIVETAPKPPPAELGMDPGDPRIYVGIRKATESMFRRTPFVLSNQGKDVAHKVRMEPFKLERKTVKIPIVEMIPAGESRDALPTVDRADGPMTEHDLFHWLLKDWNASGEGMIDEWPILIVVVYSDFSMKKCFTASMKLVFHPIRYLLETGHEWPPHDTVLWEFRDIEFKRIS